LTYLLSFRDAGRNKGGAVFPGWLSDLDSGAPVDPIAFRQASAGAQILFLLHGYNVHLAAAKQMFTRLIPLLPQAGEECMLVAVTWPGDSKLGFVSFPAEGLDADDTGRHFLNFIRDFVAPGAGLNFASHSLGARVVLETAQNVRYWLNRDARQICMAAPAVDRDCLTNPDKYAPTVRRAGRVALLSSKKDQVLKWAYPLGDFGEWLMFGGDEAAKALGRKGPYKLQEAPAALRDRILATQVPKRCKVGHGDYFPGTPTTDKHRRAAGYVEEAIRGDPTPRYASCSANEAEPDFGG